MCAPCLLHATTVILDFKANCCFWQFFYPKEFIPVPYVLVKALICDNLKQSRSGRWCNICVGCMHGECLSMWATVVWWMLDECHSAIWEIWCNLTESSLTLKLLQLPKHGPDFGFQGLNNFKVKEDSSWGHQIPQVALYTVYLRYAQPDHRAGVSVSL